MSHSPQTPAAHSSHACRGFGIRPRSAGTGIDHGRRSAKGVWKPCGGRHLDLQGYHCLSSGRDAAQSEPTMQRALDPESHRNAQQCCNVRVQSQDLVPYTVSCRLVFLRHLFLLFISNSDHNTAGCCTTSGGMAPGFQIQPPPTPQHTHTPGLGAPSGLCASGRTVGLPSWLSCAGGRPSGSRLAWHCWAARCGLL